MGRAEKELLYTTFAAVMTIVIALGMGEAVTRIYHKMHDRDRFIWIPDPYLGVVHAPNNRFLYDKGSGDEFANWHETNALGLLGEEIEVSKPAGVTRVLVLGDSFAEALQVSSEENFSVLLQRFLNAGDGGWGRAAEVINAGVSGYSPASEYLYLRRELLKLSPDVIIVQLFANDVFEDHKTAAMSLLDKNRLPVQISRYFIQEHENYPTLVFEETSERSASRKLHDWAVRHSRFLEYMYVKSFRRFKNSDFHRDLSEMTKFDDDEQFFIVQDDSPLFQDVTFRGVAWKLTEKYLLAIKDLAESRGARFLLLYIPLKSQLGLVDQREDVPSGLKYPANTYLNEALARFSGKNGIEFLDMLPVFEDNKEEDVYFEKDGHLTAIGHRLVAGELFDLLNKDLEQGF